MRTPEQTTQRMAKWSEKVEWHKNAEQLKIYKIEIDRKFVEICTARSELYEREKAKRKWWQLW